MSCDDINTGQFLLLFSSLSMRLLVFHLACHCIVVWLIRLTNCLKMGSGLARNPYWYFKWFNTDLSTLFWFLFPLCLFWTYIFLLKMFGTNQFNCNFSFSYKNWYWNMRIKGASSLWSSVYYSINFQIRQILAKNQSSLLLQVKNLLTTG